MNINDRRCLFCRCQVDNKFCTQCGWEIATTEFQEILTDYFRKGYEYTTILQFLKHYHNINISLRTLKTRLKEFGLKRKCLLNPDVELEMTSAMTSELKGPSQVAGYRTMWSRLKMFHHVSVPRNAVMVALRNLDPDGCAQRQRRRLIRRRYVSNGPNDTWHYDGYDKLKPYGFPIHGCVDGYSRRIMWLSVLHSNNNPIFIARLYLDCILSVNGCPIKTRSDCGSENVIAAAMQCYLRRTHDNSPGANAHLYGSSHANQRIENWWSYYRRTRSSYIIDFFKSMVEEGIFNQADSVHLACCQYCFSKLIQNDLDEVVEHWNSHYIRKSGAQTVSGRPDQLYFLPHLTQVEDQINTTNQDDITLISEELSSQEESTMIDDDVLISYEYFDHLVLSLSLNNSPRTFESALQLYRTLLQHAKL